MKRPDAPPRPTALVIAAALGLSCLGASVPEIVTVRVPASKAGSWFPAGTDLRVLTPDQFDDLAQRARAAPGPAAPPRILKARHSARWEFGALSGRTEVAIDPATLAAGPGLILLEPWSPALVGSPEARRWARATADGRLALKVDPATPPTLAFDWRLQAGSGTEGRGFTLDLPAFDVSGLDLDLPSGLAPESDAGARVGPEPGVSPGRSSWRFDGARGRIKLRLLHGPEDRRRPDGPRLWLEGPTRIDLNASPANWRAEWILEGSPGAPERLTIELDPGVELLDVSGPRVASFRVEPKGPGGRVAVGLNRAGSGASTPLVLRGNCQAPSEGMWAIPGARPVDATWTGGRTSVRIDPSRVLQGCSERSGRRVSARGGDPADPSALVFEPGGAAGPVAELSFRKPSAEATVEVQGRLKLDRERPEIEVALTWKIERGQLLSHAADLAPGWVPDRAVAADGQVVPWHAEALTHGGTRVHLSPSPLEMEQRSLTVILWASSRRLGSTGPLELPRVRPAPGSGKVSDEVWVAPRVDDLAVRPIQGRGLAWIDPPPPGSGPAAPWASAPTRGALAWRWLLDDADGGIELIPLKPSARVRTRLDAAIVAGRSRLDFSLAIDPAASGLRSLPIHLDAEVAEPLPWRPADPAGPDVVARPLDAPARASLGLPATGSAWELEFSKVPTRPFELKSRVELPWAGSGAIPLLTVPAWFQAAGLVALRVEESARCRVESSGVGRIDRPEGTSDSSILPDPALVESGPRLRLAARFEQGPAGGRIFASTSTAATTPAGGLVREATLASRVFAGSGPRHRLGLGIHAGSSRSIELSLPPGSILDRIRLDGRRVAATPAGRSIRVALPAATAARPSTLLTLDYRFEDPSALGPRPLRLDSILPTCSLPCLSFVWEIAAPETWDVGEPSPGLLATEPRPARSRWERLLGLTWAGSSGDGTRARPVDRDAILLELDSLPGGIKDGETSLGEWLLKLDAGRWPLVVDRLALRAAGLGPGTRVGSSSPSRRASTSAALALQSLGLAAERVGSALLITTPAEAPGRSAATPWVEAVRRAVVEGSDGSDRYQSADRWGGEATPRAPAAGEAMDRVAAASGWRVRRFAAVGWPGPSASVRLDDRSTGPIRGWGLTLLIVAAAVMARDRPWRLRGSGASTILGVAAILFSLSWPGPSDLAPGLLRGALLGVGGWVGLEVARRIRGSQRFSGVPWPGRARGVVAGAGAMLLGLSVLGLAAAGIASEAGPERPILALFPEAGPPGDPASRPDRVLMRVADHDRLRRLAHPRPPEIADRALLASAEHRVEREGRELASVVSRYEVEVAGEGPATWPLPIGQALELSASVDDKSVPLDIAADAGSATVALAGPGLHRLEFRRSVRLEPVGAGGRRIRVAINRAPFARALVGRGPIAGTVELPGALGRVDAREGGASGLLGPAGVLEARWWPGDRTPPGSNPGDVEAAILWDASPLGDLARARLVHSGPEPLTSLRLEVEPGVLARSFAIPGSTLIQQAGTPGRPEWVVALDPPLPPGVPFELEFWRSAGAGGPSPRSLPRFRLAGARRFSGVLGFRRPSDWSGRLETRDSLKPLEEAEFVRAWGPLPGVGSTLAGTARFEAFPEVATTIGLPGRRRSVRADLRCELGPGRLGATLDAVLSDREGRSFEAELGLPTDFRITKLEAGGLVDWQGSGRDWVRLQFNGSEVRDRRIHLEGYVPAPADSAMSESRSYLAQIPWPRWFGVEAESGQLILSGPNHLYFDPAPRDAPPLTLGPTSGPGYRLAYRVDRPEGLGPIRWDSPTSMVGVSIRSDLVIRPSGVTWTAVVDCDVSGGPAEKLHWRLPGDWAEHATLEVDGTLCRPVADPKGETTDWTIIPPGPIWGRARLVLRSTRPLAPGRAFAFPEIAPLSNPGRGTLDRRDLAIANLTGRPLEVAGSAGLQAIDASRYKSEESSAPAGSFDRAYHVTGDRWSLQVRPGGPEDRAAADGDDRPPSVESAHLCATVAADGATWGCAHYALGPHPGPFLAITLPEPASIPWASVDGRRAVALRDRAGRWSVALGDRAARRVDLCWSVPAPPGPAPPRQALALPALDQAGVPTTIRTFASASTELASPSGSATVLVPTGWQLAIAERLAARVVAAMGDFDRASKLDRRTLVEDLTRFELRGRAIERRGGGRDASTRFGPLRTSIEDAGQDSGLEDAIEEARTLVGLLPPTANPPGPGPVEPLRIRHLGESRGFRATSGGGGRPIDLEFVAAPGLAGWSQVGFRAVAGTCLASAIVLALGVPRGRARRATPPL